MTGNPDLEVGAISWIDLTIDDAEAIQDFYCQVMGWRSTPHAMGDYHDFDIRPPGKDAIVTGICYARDSNANIPPHWLICINVANVEESARQCLELGGKILDGPRMMGESQFCVIQDPAGAVAALISQ